MLSVVKLTVVMLSVTIRFIMLRVIILSVGYADSRNFVNYIECCHAGCSVFVYNAECRRYSECHDLVHYAV